MAPHPGDLTAHVAEGAHSGLNTALNDFSTEVLCDVPVLCGPSHSLFMYLTLPSSITFSDTNPISIKNSILEL